jgi:hypothetical protein
MRNIRVDYSPIEGKTYSLFGNSDSTSEYYETIRLLVDKVQSLNPDISALIENIRRYSSKKRRLKKVLRTKNSDDQMSSILNLIDPDLKKYTEKTEEHLSTLPLSKLLDRRLSTSREQYHLYMVEIELTNRLFSSEFIKTDKKIALLPYCLQDFSVKCKSEKNGFDYQCNHCSTGCFQNHASEILKDNHIEPYIWMGGNMKKLANYTLKEGRTLAVLGIACIPELIWGMRECRKNRIPAIGIPLNANRCVRWFGEFHQNSIDLKELEKLLLFRYC